MSMTVLDKIIAYKKDEVAKARRETPLAVVEAAAKAAPAVRPFEAMLRKAALTRPALIAEIKKASPSKGLIRADFDPPALAAAYERGGAACLSVLTDGPSFMGAPHHLIAARAAGSLPVLRKDFMIDPYQVIEARGWGADCILLIMASLSDAQASELYGTAMALQLGVLVETHTEDEVERALRLGPAMIGVNNRDLKTFVTDIAVTERLAASIGDGRLIVSESGIATPADIARLSVAGAGAFLVGESLMRASDVAAATAELLGIQSSRR